MCEFVTHLVDEPLKREEARLAGGVPRLAHVENEMNLARFKEHVRAEATLVDNVNSTTTVL